MAKTKTIFVCSECGYESPKWLGKCPACQAWNTFYEEKMVESKVGAGSSKEKKAKTSPRVLNEVVGKSESRTSTGISELDRVLRRRTSKWFTSITRGRARYWKIYIGTRAL